MSAENEMADKAMLSALGQGINLTALRTAIPVLEAACNRKIEAQEDYKNAITVAALKSGIIPAVLSQYIVARVTDTVARKARSAVQLNLLFDELAD